MATNIDLGVFNLYAVRRLKFTIKKDGVAWAGIDSVALIFEKPDRTTQFTRAMTVFSDALGQWTYDTTVADLETVGNWTVTLQVTDAQIVDRYAYEIGFVVVGNP